MAVTDFIKAMAVAIFTNKRERLTVWGEKIRRFAERLTPYNRAPRGLANKASAAMGKHWKISDLLPETRL